MQACYVNTTHPDFINGHKAMSIVNDRLNAAKPQPPANDPKKVTASQINNNKDLDVEAKKDEPSFFGSFFSSASKNGKKRGPNTPVMEAPPPIIKPQAALSDRETMETEVISE
jgi:vacuolar protein sorting-associated protein 1